MKITHTINSNNGSFFATFEEKAAGRLDIRILTDILCIDHTEIDPAYRGRHFGEQLVEAAVAYAREHQMKVMPYCEFARKVMQKKTGFNDIIDTSW